MGVGRPVILVRDWRETEVALLKARNDGTTPTLVQRFTAGRVSEGVRVIWEVADGATAPEIWVERAAGANGQAWTEPVMERSVEGRAVVEAER